MADLFVAEQSGPPGAPRVVLVHGSLDRSSALGRTARLLADLHVIRYDRRGYGRSLDAGPVGDLGTHVDDLRSVLDEQPAVIAGHSIGGVVALALAQLAPELVRAVLAYEAPMAWQPWWPGRSAGGAVMAATDPGDAAESFMRRMIGDARWEALPPRTRAQRRAEGPALVAEMRAVRAPAPAPYDPESITVPVVAAHGSRCAPHHRRATRLLATAAPAGALVVVEGADHGIHLTHPAAYADLVRHAVARA